MNEITEISLQERIKRVASKLKILEDIKDAYPVMGRFSESFTYTNGVTKGIKIAIESLIENKDSQFDEVMQDIKRMVDEERTRYRELIDSVREVRQT